MLLSLAIYTIVTWQQSDGSFPVEVLELVAASTVHRTSDYANLPMGDVDPGPDYEGWYNQHDFTFRTTPKALLERSRRFLTKNRGWDFQIANPTIDPYCFSAVKKDALGKMITEVDFAGEAVEGDCFLHAVDMRHRYPMRRAQLAEEEREREIRAFK